MNFKSACIAGLTLLLISRILLANGADFLYTQETIDWTHWLMLIGAVLTISFSFVFPKSIFNSFATILTALGIIAHIGMCTIDFILWSYGSDNDGRNELVGHLMNTPSIWLPFITVGPALLYSGLATHAWKFIISHTVQALMVLIGSGIIGLGQIVWNDMIIVVFGFLLFSAGLILLIYRKEPSSNLNLWTQMKNKKYYLLGALILIVGSYFIYNTISNRIEAKKHRAWVENLENTASKNVHILSDTITIDYLNEKRTLAIYLPENYATDSVDYPVIYFLDGQSLFDKKIQEGTEWEIDEVLDSLGNIGQEQSIIVGIYNSYDRMKEYKPFPSTRWYSDKVVHGDQHAKWVVNSLKPWIDTQFRTKKDPASTIIGGASLGGLMSYYMLMEYPDVFGGAIVFSPSFWVNEIVYSLHENNKNLFNQKIYFDAGELETPTVESIYKMRDILLAFGMPEENIKLDVEVGEGHWHMTWRKGFKKVYPWIVQGK